MVADVRENQVVAIHHTHADGVIPDGKYLMYLRSGARQKQG
jgi:hypothetical protein